MKPGFVQVRPKVITGSGFQAARTFRESRGRERSFHSPFRMGETVVATGQTIREQPDRSLDRWEQSSKKLRERFSKTGDTAFRRDARILHVRMKRAVAALIAALSMANTAGAEAASPAASGARPGSARIRVSAAVASLTSLRILRQQPSVTITGTDIARGYVDAPSASRIEVRTNNPQGCMLVFEGLDGPFRETVVRGMGREVQIGPGPGLFPMPRARGPVTVEISYRFVLSGNARPGTYSWPLAISSRAF